MSLFRTPTPNYQRRGDRPLPPADRFDRFDPCGWLKKLIRTPTPNYQKPNPDGYSETSAD